MPRKKLGEMLVEAGVLTPSGLSRALGEQKRWGGTLGRTVVELKLVSEPELVRVLAQQLNLPTVDLETIDIHATVLDLVPAEVAQEHMAIPFAQPMKFLDVAMADPTNLGVIDELRIRTQLNIRPYLAGPKMIERAIGKFYKVGFGRFAARPDLVVALDGEAAGSRVAAPPDELRVHPRAYDLRNPQPVKHPRASTPVLDPLGELGDLGGAGDGGVDVDIGPPALDGHPHRTRDAEIDALQERISALEALVARDEEVLRKVLALLVEKGVATREEILERIR